VNPKQEAAGSGAAYQTLVSLYPKQQQQTKLFDNRRADFELALPAAKDAASFQYGTIVAQQLLYARIDDVPTSVDTYNPPAPGPGVWEPDAALAPPGPPLTPGWGDVRPFLLDSTARVLPPRFPELTDGDYTFGFRNVRDKGGAIPPPPPPPQGPTADEKNIAVFWSADDREGSPIRLYNLHAFEILDQEPNVPAVASVLHRHARMFALINLAMADTGIACWEAKFLPPCGYHIWRPFQGIPRAADDDNPDTQPVANWRPLGRPQGPVPNSTPNFPAYPSGHSSFGAAMFGMLRKFFGAKPFPFTLSSPELPNKRAFADKMDPQTGEVITSWTQAMNENDLSRIFLGVHWRRDHTQGRPLGQQVADYIWPDFLRPTT
jgi:membrane-associated phospholipid phosphatase